MAIKFGGMSCRCGRKNDVYIKNIDSPEMFQTYSYICPCGAINTIKGEAAQLDIPEATIPVDTIIGH